MPVPLPGDGTNPTDMVNGGVGANQRHSTQCVSRNYWPCRRNINTNSHCRLLLTYYTSRSFWGNYTADNGSVYSHARTNTDVVSQSLWECQDSTSTPSPEHRFEQPLVNYHE
uniref:Uncharacterized protein n=1 Tax=Cannabis sativa TaxID=3483 RepID=A0A803P9B1_CANSA